MSRRTHTIDGHEIVIEWEIVDTIDTHDNDFTNVALEGEGDNGNKYTATGDTLSGDLEDVYDIEQI